MDNPAGYVNATVDLKLLEQNGTKYYHVLINEGNIYLDEIEMNYDDLTTIFEKRTDIKNNYVVEKYNYLGNNNVCFYNKEKNINKNFKTCDANIYSRYAYFVSFRGFPFSVGTSVYFKTYMFECGDAIPMKLSCVALQNIKVKAGNFNCYKLELSVAGWRSFFSSDKYYLYFAKDEPHLFIKYEETTSCGTYANELISVENKK